MGQTIQLSVELVNAILGYLGNRPYGEVFTLIGGIQSEATGQLPPPTTTTQDAAAPQPADAVIQDAAAPQPADATTQGA